MTAEADLYADWLALSADERAAWSGFLRAHAEVARALDSELTARVRLPLSSYDVLLQLSRAPEHRLRMSDLAEAVLLSRSGLTRLVERLEREGLVERCRSAADSREIFAAVTATGLSRLRGAVPVHIAGIRARFLDRLGPGDCAQLAAIWSRLLDDAADCPAE